ncbi:MAG: O-antigen ligase family protein [Candidatus Doudnabacteria bacterium]|nr:O-antigen ligase family protein [Candidatus Doudnabacteria bacterium]
MIGLLAIILALVPSYLIRFHIAGLPTTLLEVLIVAFLFIIVIVQIQNRFSGIKKIKQLGSINYAIILFLTAGVIGTLMSPDKLSALGQFKAYLLEPVLLFYGVILTVKQKEQSLRAPILALFWSAVIISALGIFQHYSFIFLPIRFWGNGEELTRIVSVFEYPNALSLYLAPLLGFFTALWFADYDLTKRRWTGILALAIIGWALILTFSRGAWISAVIGILFILFKEFEFKRVILPILIAGVLLLLLPGVRDRLSLGLSDASSSAHYELLKVGFNKVTHSPIFGNGLAGFRTTQAESGYAGEILNYPHNFLLNFWLELGILGLISFIWIIILAFYKASQNNRELALAVSVYLIIVLIHGLVDVPYFKNDLSVLFWFMLSLLYIKF